MKGNRAKQNAMAKNQQAIINEEQHEVETDHDNNRTELTKMEVELCRQNFQFYDKQRVGYVERFELPMVLTACGYNLDDTRIQQLNEFLDEKKSSKIDINTMLMVLTQLKELELMHEAENDADEYLDAFVALGGMPNKEGTISKNTLIQIIKSEFELTIDMEEYLRKIGGDTDHINYYQFCVMLDAGTSGNPSRVSSYLSQNRGSSFMRFSYFVNNYDKLMMQ